MEIELKNIKHAAFASEETSCYSASLYVDGTKIGEVSNEGRGGPDLFRGNQEAYAKAKAKADAWCRANLPKWSLPEFSDEEHERDLEHHCNDLLGTWLITRDYKRLIKNKVLFTCPDEAGVFQIKYRGQFESAAAQVAARYPNARILNSLPLDEAVRIFRENAGG